MSGWSGIYYRYEIEDRGFRGEKYKGLVGNRYKGFEPYHIFVRATEAGNAAHGCLFFARYGDLDVRISRTLDVDFVNRFVEFSRPATLWDKSEIEEESDYDEDQYEDADCDVDQYEDADCDEGSKEDIGCDVDQYEDADCDEEEEETLGIIGSSFFFNDCNYYGGCMIDVKGYINERVEESEEYPFGRRHDLYIKYAFVDNTEYPTKIMTPRQYVEHFSNYFTEEYLGKETVEEINKILAKCDEGSMGELMTVEELAEFVSTASVKEYLGNE